MSKPSVLELMGVAIDAAPVAGRRTLGYFNAGVVVETKADNTPVTRADREAEELIRAAILGRYPRHAIVGEEYGNSPGSEAVKWLIDPIDGTKSFVRGVPQFGTLIGVEVEGEAVVGVMYLPATDELIAAGKGLGCTWNGRPTRTRQTAALSGATVCFGDPAHLQGRGRSLDKLIATGAVLRGWADCYGYALVATGRADVAIDPIMNPWDCGPMLTILGEAGGVFTDWEGTPTLWGKDAMASATAGLHAELRRVLAGA